ncbi:MAG: transporter substrate-binding domain-containing protein [Bacteroidales bacterium]|nr:transporter substrate-binding domain-containing protein [Bacteroidales bacterium]
MKQKLILVMLLFFLLVNGISAGKSIVYYGDNNYPPYAYTGKDGEPAGFEVELIREIGRIMEFDLSVQLKDWHEVVAHMKSGESNVVSSMLHTQEREQYVNYSIPYIKITYAIFTRKGSDVEAVDDLRDSVIIVQESDVMHDYVLENSISFRLILAKNQKEALRMLASGRGAAALCAKMQGYYYISEYKLLNLESHELPLESFDYCYVSPKGNEEVIATINEGLNILKETGRFDELHEKWFGIYREDNLYSFIRQWGSWILAALVVAGILIIAWIYTLNKSVAGKTLELREELDHRKIIEQQLRIAKNKAEESDRLKSAFLANMSHEIRTPMNGIIGYAEMLRDEKLEKEEQQRFTDSIVKNTHKLLHIITDLINISKIETGQLKVSHMEFDPNDLMNELYELFVDKIDSHIDFKVNSKTAGLNKTLKGDREKIRKVVMNLLDNAAKFTSQGYIKLDYDLIDNRMKIMVEDTGAGIPMHQQQKVFENFWQVDPNDVEKGGTGLGLSIAKGFVEAMKGKITLKSTPGKGSTFTVYIPVEVVE